MATVSPIAAVAVLPLAIANGGRVRPEQHRLDLHAASSASSPAWRPTGCWSTRNGPSRSAPSASRRSCSRRWRSSGRSCCSGEHLRHRAGRRDRHGDGRVAGLPGSNAARPSGRSRARAHAVARRSIGSVMKCDATSIRRSDPSISRWLAPRRPTQPPGGPARPARTPARGGTLVACATRAPRQSVLRTGHPSRASSAASRHSPRSACSPPPARAVPGRRRLQGVTRLVEPALRTQHAAQMHPASAASRTSPVASAF